MPKGTDKLAGSTGPKKTVELHNGVPSLLDRTTMAVVLCLSCGTSTVVLCLYTEYCARDSKAVLLLVNQCDLALKRVGSHFGSLEVFLHCAKKIGVACYTGFGLKTADDDVVYSSSQKSASKPLHCCTLQHSLASPTALVS